MQHIEPHYIVAQAGVELAAFPLKFSPSPEHAFKFARKVRTKSYGTVTVDEVNHGGRFFTAIFGGKG